MTRPLEHLQHRLMEYISLSGQRYQVMINISSQKLCGMVNQLRIIGPMEGVLGDSEVIVQPHMLSSN